MKSEWQAQKDLIDTLPLHPEYPLKVWVVVEQPRSEAYRVSYDPECGVFSKTAYKSLLHARGFRGVYGWIGGSGIPPEPHYDVLLLTEQVALPGEIIEGWVSGVFFRRDGDHKFVAMDEEFRRKTGNADIQSLKKEESEELLRLYPEVREGEGWFGADVARDYLANNSPVHS